jgi:hypothetical protein
MIGGELPRQRKGQKTNDSDCEFLDI